MAADSEEIVFAPLGGLGEIGMNAALYGFGTEKKRKYIMVDCGVAFAGADMPGVDLILPDPAFIEKNRKDLLGLIITHAHEDHVGAIAALWPRLGCPVYATRFAAGLLRTRRLAEPGAPQVPIHEVTQGSRLTLGRSKSNSSPCPIRSPKPTCWRFARRPERWCIPATGSSTPTRASGGPPISSGSSRSATRASGR